MRLPDRVAAVLLVCAAAAQAGESLSYGQLAARLADLEQLAVLPAPGEKCEQWSSYDRKSQYDAATGQYIQWAANGDGDGCIREENGKFILGEMKGPGVIWRIWSALPQKGHVAIYLDGDDKPVVDLPFKAYFNRSSPPFDLPGLVHRTSGGQNCYVPIPYQKSCRIVADADWGRYYHFTYSTFSATTQLPTFSRTLTPSARQALEKVDAIIQNCGDDPAGPRDGETIEGGEATVASGQTGTLVSLKGPRAITAIRLKVDLPPVPQDALALRELVLRIHWDGQAEACVCTPLGDFFGSAPGVAEYKSLPIGMSRDGFYSFWYMPFDDNAVLQITNEGRDSRHIRYEITHAPLSRPNGSLGRFHARWHADDDLAPARPIDWTMLKCRGRGRFCGVMLHVWNPRGGWWGEGDEKFLVDGELFPSTFGTGSEDYFGYAWCSEKPFEHAFHNQTVSVPKNGCGNRSAEDSGGHISNNRWQIADNVPFQTSFEGAIEKYFTTGDLTRYSCVTYWYQSEPHDALPPLAPLADRTFGIDDNQSRMLRFLREGKTYAAGQPIEPLRELYPTLVADPGLAQYHLRLTVRMARAEKTAGNERRARELLAPLMRTLVVPFVSRDYAEDILAVTGKQASRPGAVRPLIVENDDGSTRRELRDNQWCIVTQSDQGKPFIYFALPEQSQLRKNERLVVFRVRCFSDGQPGRSFTVHYNSAYSDDIAGHYHESARVELPPQPGWHTFTVRCERTRFAGRQNNHADFRIAADHGDVAVADIEIGRD